MNPALLICRKAVWGREWPNLVAFLEIDPAKGRFFGVAWWSPKPAISGGLVVPGSRAGKRTSSDAADARVRRRLCLLSCGVLWQSLLCPTAAAPVWVSFQRVEAQFHARGSPCSCARHPLKHYFTRMLHACPEPAPASCLESLFPPTRPVGQVAMLYPWFLPGQSCKRFTSQSAVCEVHVCAPFWGVSRLNSECQ